MLNTFLDKTQDFLLVSYLLWDGGGRVKLVLDRRALDHALLFFLFLSNRGL